MLYRCVKSDEVPLPVAIYAGPDFTGDVVGAAELTQTPGFPVRTEGGPPEIWRHDGTLEVRALDPGFAALSRFRILVSTSYLSAPLGRGAPVPPRSPRS